MKWAGLMIAVLWPAGALAGTLTFTGPDDWDALPFSVYRADDTDGAPVAQVPIGQPTDLAEGAYVYGIDAYAWRSAPFEIEADDETEILLGAVRLDAPEATEDTFDLFAIADGKLLAPLTTGYALPVPEGQYVVRRDLAETEYQVAVDTGEITAVSLGAITLSGPGLPPGQTAYIADAETRRIAATVLSFETPVALFSGNYLIAATPGVPPVPITIAAGETTELRAPVIRWADGQADGVALSLTDVERETVLPLPIGGVTDIVAFNVTIVDAREGADSLGQVELPTDARTILWRLNDGRLPLFDGLPLDLATDGPRFVARGTIVRLASNTPERADMQLFLHQGERTVDLGNHRFGPGISHTDVQVPDDLSDDSPVHFSITGPTGAALTGQTEPIPVHRQLLVGVDNLAVSSSSATTVALAWTLPAGVEISGVNVFRGADERPVNGRRAITGESFADIGLSAGRAYTYRVCPIDTMGFLGPCETVEARTDTP